ncbi:MAG: hypothetical protein ACYTG4_02660 [Planctomycetota bacterium]|jgi:hypothetical protein
MHRWIRPLTALAVASAFLVLVPVAEGTKGFVSKRTLNPVRGSSEPDMTGGISLWLKVRGNGSRVQQVSAWFKGAFDAEGATLWMAQPGESELEAVADFATADNGSGLYKITVDDDGDGGNVLPAGADNVLELLRAPVEIRIPGFDLDDEPVLFGKVADFRYKTLPGSGRKSVRSKKRRLRLPPEPLPLLDDSAKGFIRIWKRKKADSFGDRAQGIVLFARGLLEDDDYEVWIEDEFGDMQEVGEIYTTIDGQGLWDIDTGRDDTLPFEAGIEDVRDLQGRRIELRRFGEVDYSLAGLFPRIR